MLNCRYVATNRQLLSYVLKILAIYATIIYSVSCVMLLRRAASITRASGRGLGPGNRHFIGPCDMASTRQASATWEGEGRGGGGQKAASKALRTGPYKSYVHRWFYPHPPPHPELIRNQQEAVRCIKERSGTGT